MDLDWISIAAIILASSLILAFSASYLVLMNSRGNEIARRNMRVWKPSARKTLDYRGTDWESWAGIVEEECRKAYPLVPVSVRPFADYVDGRKTVAEYSRGADYGLAVGFASMAGKKAGKPVRQISLVFSDEELSGNGPANLNASLAPVVELAGFLAQKPEFSRASFERPLVDSRLSKEKKAAKRQKGATAQMQPA